MRAPWARPISPTRSTPARDRAGQAVELHDEDRRGVGREAGVDVGLDGPGDGGVHHLQRGRHQAGGDDRAHRRRAVLHAVEVEEQRAHLRRVLREAHADAGGDAEHALAADEDAPQVEPRRLGVLPAEDGDRAVRQDHLDGEDVHGGHALRQAVGPAGVGRHVAADRAALLARRVGRVVHAVLGQLPGEVGVEHAGLDPRLPAVEVDRQHPVHLRRDDHDGAVRAGRRRRPGRSPSPGRRRARRGGGPPGRRPAPPRWTSGSR